MLSNGSFPLAGATLLLLTGLSGCGGAIKIAEYPDSWPPRIASSPGADCPDISGTYTVTDGPPLLPFFLFGITDNDSPDWTNLVRIYEQRLLADPDGATVTIESPDADHLEVVLAMHGMSVARKVLTRSRQSENAAVWFGQRPQSFRCEPNGIVINGSYVHDWDVYSLSYEEKKRRYRRVHGAVGPLGVSEGYFYFSKTTNGGLVMRAHLYGCYPCNGLDEYWRRWEPAPSPAAKQH